MIIRYGALIACTCVNIKTNDIGGVGRGTSANISGYSVFGRWQVSHFLAAKHDIFTIIISQADSLKTKIR